MGTIIKTSSIVTFTPIGEVSQRKDIMFFLTKTFNVRYLVSFVKVFQYVLNVHQMDRPRWWWFHDPGSLSKASIFFLLFETHLVWPMTKSLTKRIVNERDETTITTNTQQTWMRTQPLQWKNSTSSLLVETASILLSLSSLMHLF